MSLDPEEEVQHVEVNESHHMHVAPSDSNMHGTSTVGSTLEPKQCFQVLEMTNTNAVVGVDPEETNQQNS